MGIDREPNGIDFLYETNKGQKMLAIERWG